MGLSQGANRERERETSMETKDPPLPSIPGPPDPGRRPPARCSFYSRRMRRYIGTWCGAGQQAVVADMTSSHTMNAHIPAAT